MTSSYPGEDATADQILGLASEFKNAAISLRTLHRKRNALSLAPCRFAALHAIELYLNARLLLSGSDPKVVRGLQHNFAARTEKVTASGLVLRKRTAQHLSQLAGNREYLLARYSPEMTPTLSQINRLMATLHEVATKIERAASARSSTPKQLTG